MKKTPKKIKNMTIDDLAIMVAKGFSSMDERFNTMDERFDAMDERFDGVDKRMDTLEGDMKKTRHDILNVGDKFVPRYEFDTLLVRVGHLESEVRENRKK